LFEPANPADVLHRADAVAVRDPPLPLEHACGGLAAELAGGQKLPKPIRAFNKAWKKACTAGGCPGSNPHDLRRTSVRNLVLASIPKRVAVQMTGHKTRSVFERHNIISKSDLLDAARRFDRVTPAAGAQQV